MSARKTFLSVGECMVELSPGEGDCFRMGFAGDTFNTAWYARRLLGDDWTVGYASCVGTDAISDRMLETMQSAGIDTATVRRMPDRTVGLYLIQLDNGERSFAYWRGEAAARALANDPVWLSEVFGTADVIFYSGITLAILSDAARDTFCAALARARAGGATTVLDTNMRARLWPGEDAMRAGIMQGAAQADIVLPSLDEEEAVFGEAEAPSVAARYHAAGARLVVVKNGAGEILVSDSASGSFTHAPKAVTQVIDSTAAGDSFDAAFLSAYLQGQGLETAAARGADLAGKVVQARGALVEPE
ncbi:MAG: sugar kinase [Thalassovita sp.]|nr:sugar kinase [Thalassovita sp.]